jgi:hypothetical protein
MHRSGAPKAGSRVIAVRRRSSQRQFQSHPSGLILRLVIGHQEDSLRINLRTGQQGLLQVQRALLPQRRQIRLVNGNVRVHLMVEKVDSCRDLFGLRFERLDRIGILRLGAEILRVELRQQFELSRGIHLVKPGRSGRRPLARSECLLDLGLKLGLDETRPIELLDDGDGDFDFELRAQRGR